MQDEWIEEVDDEEECYPNDIDEVPVVRHADRADFFVVREVLRGVSARENKKEGDEPAKDVQAVEA